MSEKCYKILDERCGLVARTVHALSNSSNMTHRTEVSRVLNEFVKQYSNGKNSIFLEDWADNVLVELTKIVAEAEEELYDDNVITADLLLYMTEAFHEELALKLGQRLAQQVLLRVA